MKRTTMKRAVWSVLSVGASYLEIITSNALSGKEISVASRDENRFPKVSGEVKFWDYVEEMPEGESGVGRSEQVFLR